MKPRLLAAVLFSTLLAGCQQGHSHVHPSAGSTAKTVDYTVDGKMYEGYYVGVTSGAGKAGTVIIIHDWDGLTDYEKKRAHMLAALGYNVFAGDLFGKGIRPTAIEDKKKLTGALYKDRDAMRARLRGALKTAAAQGADLDNAVVMGYCFGGAATLELAMAGEDIKGFAPFHGGLAIPEGQDYSKTKGSVLVLHGTADTVVPMADFAKLAEELEKQGVKHEMISYSGAPHAFTVFGRDVYRKDADEKSWARFTAFLNEVLD